MMLSRIMLTGVPGVGKTSVAQDPRISDMGISTKNFGKLMFIKGKQLGIVSTPDELETLSLEHRAQLQAEAARLVEDESVATAIVIDGHLIVDTASGFVPGLPTEYISKLKLTSIVLLLAEPDEVIVRRKKHVDKYDKLRNWNSEERIKTHQNVLFDGSLQYALLSGASFDILRNSQDKLDETVQGFISFLNSLVPSLLKP